VIDIDIAKNNASSADSSAIRTINAEHSKNICSLDWSSNGNYLVASSENAVIVYETGQWKRINMQTATNKISACAFATSTGDSGPAAATKLRVVYGD
jgi:WD40 repeat protein